MSRESWTLIDNLVWQLEHRPDAEVSRLVDASGLASSITVRQLLERAMAFARRLGPPREQRAVVAVCLYHGLDLHAAFLGALWAGHLPTMIAPPSPRMELHKYASAFGDMLAHVRPTFVITDGETRSRLSTLSPGRHGAEFVDAATIEVGESVAPHQAHPDDIAVLQHSSGTTGLQKGVALTHRAILDHHRVYRERLAITKTDVIVSWLPLYHDMGFIACFLLPILEQVLLVELSPFDWVARPAMLLDAISSHRGTLCWLPNFAFQFLADSVRVGQLDKRPDLSSIRAFINSSEPVMDASNQAFASRFATFGVRIDQLTASYAMAENVYAVTQSLPGRYRTLAVDRVAFTSEHRIVESDGGVTFVSNGVPIEGTELVVLGANEAVLEDDHVGELAIRGISRFAGYYNRSDLTGAAIMSDGFFRTGDLGFVHHGEVYVTGRKKDLIIIQGRNFYPNDIERVVGDIDGVMPGRAVVFGIGDLASGTEKLIVLVETTLEAEELQRRLVLAIRKQIAQTFDCTPGDVRVVPSRWLVKSTSGKLARGDNREKYLAALGASSS